MDIAKRATYRGQLTKLVNCILEYLKAPESQLNETNENKLDEIEEELTVYLARLSTVQESLEKLNGKDTGMLKPEEFLKESDSIAEYEDKAVSTISRLNQRLAKLRQIQNKNSSNSTNLSPPSHIMSSAAKLPKLSLKIFSGDFKEWLPFWEIFRTAIHERPNLSGADKFNYLQLHLTGKAADSIAGFIPSEENYNAAISLLQEQFGDNEKLIEHSMQQLMSLPNITSRRDIHGLRKIYNSVTSSTRSLTILSVPLTQYSVMLKSLLLKCMPDDLVVDFYRTRQEVVADKSEADVTDVASLAGNENSSPYFEGDKQVRDILKFLKAEIESLERSVLMQNRRASLSVPTTQNFKTAAGLLTSDEPSICCFCKKESHSSQRCQTPMDLHQRKEILLNERRCFRCTQKGHNSRNCYNKLIRCDHCKGRHSTSMCDPSYIAASNNQASKEIDILPVTSLCSTNYQSSDVYLQTAYVIASNPLSLINSRPMRLILDGGSQRSYVTQNTVSQLGLKLYDKVSLRILPFGSKDRVPVKQFDRVQIKLKSRFDDKFILVLAIVVPCICIDILPVPNANCPMFAGLDLADSVEIKERGLHILIGADYYWEIVSENSKRILKNLVAINSIFGWTLHGPVMSPCNTENLILANVSTTLNICTLDGESLKRFWDLESIGITDDKFQENFSDFDNFIKTGGDRYEASLLWRKDNVLLNDNRDNAFVRFKKLVAKLSKEESKLLEYDAAMQELISNGIAEEVNYGATAQRIFYLPHRPVYKYEKATTKMRIVFDASAQVGSSLSLNQNLTAGPNLLPDLVSVILNFRLGIIGLVADIEKAFLQISLAKQDQDCHRFFWFRTKITDTAQLPPPAVFRMTRVTFGVTCSPFILCATLKKHFINESIAFPETCNILQRSFYMDDLVTSVNDVKTAINVYKEVCEILARAHMRIRKWNSNCYKLRTIFNDKPPEIQKVLGLIWVCNNDELAIDLRQVSSITYCAPTKRNVLQFIAKIFDPVGILGPFVVKLKLLFQTLWRLHIDWDEPMPSSLQTTWNNSLSQISMLKKVTLPRCVFTTNARIIQELHVFADASIGAYGTVAYIRSVNEDKTTNVAYLCSKNRVAPLKKDVSVELTLPKLELTAALIAARLAAFLIEHLNTKFDKIYLWSDSKIALHWIHNKNQKFKPYILNRVQEIKRLTVAANWRHCPGTENPADLLTRGISGSQLINASSWIHGPSWLSSDQEHWPKNIFEFPKSISLFHLQVVEETNSSCNTLPLFSIEKFSRYRKVIRITAYILRFIDNIKRKQLIEKFITNEEMQRAETYWIKYIQYKFFSVEIMALKGGKPLMKSSSVLMLNPMMDVNGILRIQTRLQESSLNYNAIYPILLPKSSYFTSLLVLDAHERVLHGGVNLVLTRLREKYWIIKARQLIKSLLKGCRICHRLKCPPASQPFAPLPIERLQTARPFETTGVDFAGPLYVKNSKDNKDTSKVYIMLLTCAVVRAVHLELVTSLTSESCLLALRRFFARRGIPKCMYSDNARTFKRASLELRQVGFVIESEEWQGFVSNEGVSWKFIVERAAWWGGFWERLVKVVKDILKITISRSVLTTEQLHTLLIEAESSINSRPLTYVSDDPLDLSPLTPNHFLRGFLSSTLSSTTSTTDVKLRLKWKSRLHLSNLFMKRFRMEYIQQLRSAHFSKHTYSTKIETGDVVIVYEPSRPRLFWKLAIVNNVFPGRDGKIRACELRFSNGTTLRRPIQHLYPLELESRIRPGGGCEKSSP